MRYTLILVVVAAYVVGAALGGLGPLLVPAVVFVAIPVLDKILGVDLAEPPGHHPVYDWLLRGWVPLQLALIGGSLGILPRWDLGDGALLAVGLGIVTGAGGITIAHELMHRKSRADQALAELLMTTVSYPWFCVEHVLGHHRNVATPRDPATSRLGESVYAFVPRSFVGGFRSFLRIERDYAGRRGVRWFSLRDRRTRSLMDLVAAFGLVFAVAGWAGVGFFALQSATAIALLEITNYVEHYGLVRAEVRPGEYARVAPEHSWNSNHRLTGGFLFDLPRHADHHAHASRPFYELRAWPDAPELPLGYATMVLVALVPPLWFRWMDPRVARVANAPANAGG